MMQEENRKLKGIVRNQIKEIKSLKEQIYKLKESKNLSGFDSEELSKLRKQLDVQKQKFEELLSTKDELIKAAKKDLKSSQREIEAHLNRHSNDLLELHNRLINERMSRDHLLTNLTEELVTAVRTQSNKKPSKTKEEKIIELPLDTIDKVLVPVQTEKESTGKKTIFYTAPQVPNYDQASGGKRAYLMLKLLSEDYNIICYAPTLFKDQHKAALEDLGIMVLQSLEPSQLAEKVSNVDVFIVAWYKAYYRIEEFINCFPKARLIIDTVDVHWLREERSVGNWDGITLEMQLENKANEIEVYQKADIIWTVTQEDKNAVLAEIPEADIRIVSNIHTMKEDSFIENKPDNILFFGGYNHYPNINAVKILAHQIFPQIKALNKNAKLLLAGSNGAKRGCRIS